MKFMLSLTWLDSTIISSKIPTYAGMFILAKCVVAQRCNALIREHTHNGKMWIQIHASSWCYDQSYGFGWCLRGTVFVFLVTDSVYFASSKQQIQNWVLNRKYFHLMVDFKDVLCEEMVLIGAMPVERCQASRRAPRTTKPRKLRSILAK